VKPLLVLSISLMLLASCKKESVVFEDNTVPTYTGISTVVLNNYINRLYIDVIGREPLNVEMESDRVFLRENNLSADSRTQLVDRLMFSTEFIEGDSSDRRAYVVKIYENLKARYIEGASEALLSERYGLFRGNAISDSLNGNMTSYALNMAEALRLDSLMAGRASYQNDAISIAELARRMMFNAVYDDINMNAFNFINASFDDSFFRFPTQPEFDQAYQIVELNEPSVLFGMVAQTKLEYLTILTSTGEFYEGMVIWAYQSLLSRNPTSQEVFIASGALESDLDFSAVQRTILISDEYAGFN
jgi:hypothetical protein